METVAFPEVNRESAYRLCIVAEYTPGGWKELYRSQSLWEADSFLNQEAARRARGAPAVGFRLSVSFNGVIKRDYSYSPTELDDDSELVRVLLLPIGADRDDSGRAYRIYDALRLTWDAESRALTYTPLSCAACGEVVAYWGFMYPTPWGDASDPIIAAHGMCPNDHETTLQPGEGCFVVASTES